MSWTTSLDVALHFQAMRPHDSIHQCVISDPLDLLGVFYGRKESEVVVRPNGSWQASVTAIVSPACHAPQVDEAK